MVKLTLVRLLLLKPHNLQQVFTIYWYVTQFFRGPYSGKGSISFYKGQSADTDFRFMPHWRGVPDDSSRFLVLLILQEQEILLDLDHSSTSVIRLKEEFMIIQQSLLLLYNLEKIMVQLPQLLVEH